MSYFLVDPNQVRNRRILVTAFEGEYPDGSQGNAHAAYMARTTLFGIQSFDPHCLILDLRGLTYRWGNSLLGVFQDVAQLKDAGIEPDEPPFPVMVVTSERCKHAFLSLVTPCGRPPPDWHFDDIESAIDHVVVKVDEWFAY